MKKPLIPPFTEWFERIDRMDLGKISRAVPSPTVDGRYFHWDDLQVRKPPEGLTREEWWCGLLLQRQSGSPVALQDTRSENFKWRNVDPIPERLREIDLAAGGTIETSGQMPGEYDKDRYYVNSLTEEAITSSQLEGATTTRQEAKEMFRAHRAPRDTSEQMIFNNYVTMKRIGDLKREMLTPALVLELHREVTRDTLGDPADAGRLRLTDDVNVYEASSGEILHSPPPAAELEQRLADMCDFANGETPKQFTHPVIRAIILHFWLAYDHPFVDGNGRTARALFYWAMLHYGYWLFGFVSISEIIHKAPAKYGRAFLLTETDGADLTYFIIHQLEVIDRAIGELHKYVERKSGEMRRLEERLREDSDINYRQRALLSHALRHPDENYTFRSHQSSHDIVYQTARTDLMDLERRGLFTSNKIGRTFHFRPVKDLDARLSEV